MDAAALADSTWRDQMKASGRSEDAELSPGGLIAGGYHGLLVRSFAPGATESDLNLVLWKWGAAPPSRLTLIDDENRLSTMRLEPTVGDQAAALLSSASSALPALSPSLARSASISASCARFIEFGREGEGFAARAR